MSDTITAEEFRQQTKKHSKWNAKPTTAYGKKFRSRLEAEVAGRLEFQKQQGTLINYAYETSWPLPGNIRHRLDFVCFWRDGSITFVEVKGKDLALGKAKRQLFEETYGVEVEVITK